MEKIKYEHPAIQLCGKCLGRGYIEVFEDDDFYGQQDMKHEVCVQCNGSGRVVVSSVKTTTVVAYTPCIESNSYDSKNE